MNTVYSINGPVVKVRDTADFSMMEMVYVGAKHLMGEVISVNSEETTIQVYEVTTPRRACYRNGCSRFGSPRPRHYLKYIRRHRAPS